jgi:hypothetical protein
MKYPSTRKLLYELARRAGSATAREAMRLAELPDLPDKLPQCDRNTRRALLRITACNRKRRATYRLACLKELLFGLSMSEQEALAELKKAKE